MTKKQLQSQIDDLKKEISSLKGMSNIYQSRLDKIDNELDVKHKEYLDKINSTAKERWQMLKDYLKVEEEEYAELVSSSKFGGYCGYWFDYYKVESTPVKKTRLIPIKKGKK